MRKILCDYCDRDITDGSFYVISLHIQSASSRGVDEPKHAPIIRDVCEGCRNYIQGEVQNGRPTFAKTASA